MIHGKPTQKELDTARDVLEWISEKTRKDEPYAVNAIAAFEGALEQLPGDANDL